MKILFFTSLLLGSLAPITFLPFAHANMNLSPKERQAADWKAFTLCKIKDGRTEKWAEKELLSISKKFQFEYKLTETKKISNFAEDLVANTPFCNAVEDIKDFRDWASKFDKNAGKKAFEKIKGDQRTLILFSSESMCKFDKGMINQEEVTKTMTSKINEQGWDREYYEELINDENFFLASTYYKNLLKSQGCQKKNQNISDMK